MRQATTLLARESFKRWFATPGFALILAVALVPPGLTAAWVFTHDHDVAITDITWDPEIPVAGEFVNVTAHLRNVHSTAFPDFNATIRIGYYERTFTGDIRWRDVANETFRVDGLAAGEATTVTLRWNATGGTFQVEAFADLERDVKEVEELNNYRTSQIQVRYPLLRPDVPAPEREAATPPDSTSSDPDEDTATETDPDSQIENEADTETDPETQPDSETETDADTEGNSETPTSLDAQGAEADPSGDDSVVTETGNDGADADGDASGDDANGADADNTDGNDSTNGDPDATDDGSDDTGSEPAPPASPFTVDAAITRLDWMPWELYERDNVTFEVTLVNRGPADVTDGVVELHVYTLTMTGQVTSRLLSEEEAVSIPANGTAQVTFRWRDIDRGLFAVAAFLNPGPGVRNVNVTDDIAVQQFDVQRRLIFEEPEAHATAKDFYRAQVLLPLHFTLLIPLIALFYAGSVVSDDRSRGNLVYILTRPVPRWSIPLSRFVVGFLVSVVAVLAGVLLTYLLLLGTPRADAGYLYWPLLFAMLVLFLYGAVFTLVGVMSARPYLVGLAYVLGFETLILAGRRILVNGQPLIQDWLLNFSLAHWITRAFEGWDPNAGFTILPAGEEATRAVWVILAIAALSLGASAWVMQRRELAD